jgi:hypothetical protein
LATRELQSSSARTTQSNLSNHRGLYTKRFSAHIIARAAAVALLIVAGNACSDTLRALGTTPVAADAHAAQLFEGMITRFGVNDLSPKYDVARVRIAQAALVPSRIFEDTSVWESRPTPTSRALYVSGTSVDGGKYRLDVRPSLTPPARLGDSRHSINLEQLGQISESVYRWDTRVDLAVGSVTAAEISALATAAFAAGEGRTERELREDYRAAFPRAMTAFGRGFTIDSIRSATGASGITSVAITASFHPELMQPAFPALSKYLDKYLGPAKYHFALADRAGIPLFDALGAERSLTLRFRTQAGKLTSLFGPPKPWADTLVMTADVSLKVKLFTVGFKSLVTDFVISNTGHDRSWAVIARREPNWNLPLFTESLIRSSLHRPFEGEGSSMRLSVHDSLGAQTVFTRRTQLTVQESTIMRFLGGLASHVIGELDGAVEAEEDRFFREGFVALDTDRRALLPRWR